MQTFIMRLQSNLQNVETASLDLGAYTRLSIWPILSALTIAAVAGVVLASGPSIISAPWDVFILLDGAWRIFVGQVPHTDFYNPIGALPYWLTAVGMHLGQPSLMGYVYGNLIFLLVAASWGALIFFRKLSPPVAFLLMLFLAALIVAPRPLGFDATTTTYAMIYNRYGWALISILFVQLLVANRAVSPRDGSFDGISSGLLLGLLFFCKISFFIFALAAIPLAIWLRPELRGWIVLTPIAFATVCLGAWLVVGINSLDYVRDVVLAGESQSLSHRIEWLMESLVANSIQVLLLAGIWFYLIALPAMRRQASLRLAIRTTLSSAFVAVSALIITVGNLTEGSDIPLFLIAGVILLEAWRRQQSASAERWKLLRAPECGLSSLIVIGVFFGGIFANDALSLAKSRSGRDNTVGGTSSQRFDAPRLHDFIIPRTSDYQTAYSRAGDVPARINEGLTLLRRHVSPQSRLLVLALSDPFSFALGLMPPKGAPLWWDLGFNFDRANYPAPERVFAEADFVMYPIVRPGDQGCCQETILALRELYGGYLGQHYVEADLSDHWVLLEKRH